VQVFYYLRSLDDALTHALGAGALFNIAEQSEYVKTIVGACSAPCVAPCWPLQLEQQGRFDRGACAMHLCRGSRDRNLSSVT
jgi:hypothetical protein